jgi:uncharacterized protein (DUF433 family)
MSVVQAFDTIPPPFSEDAHGVLRVGNTRISLESVVVAFDRGASAEEIADRFPGLALPMVYATIAYVLANRDFVDAYVARRKANFDELRTATEARFSEADFRSRLLSRRRGNGA